jgi:undecaprenyl-phosphate 4-deoxy-4-formamido-L-arabinose transferase
MSSDIYLSVVVPVYNEEESLPVLSERLIKVLKDIGKPFEIIYTNDGSQDRSLEILRDLHRQHPQHVRVIDFKGNFGQHMAIMAAFEHSRGDVVINLDADLQNPPEEIPKLLEKVEQGHDVVGSYRQKRNDHLLRHYGSRFANWVRSRITTLDMKDQGCMFRAYTRPIVQEIVKGGETSTFIPALAWKLASNPCEVGLRHEARNQGESKYDIYELIRVSLDLATSFSLVPIQMVTFFGMVVSTCSFVLVIYMLVRRLVIGPEVEGVFTLLAIIIFLISVAIMGIGIIGEYVGRTYQAVSKRPRYVIREIIETEINSSKNKKA